MEEQVRHVVCPHCDAVNRFATGKPADAAKCGRCHKPLLTRAPISVTASRFPVHIQRNDIPVVVDFWAEWCGPCKAMAPAYERVAAELEPEARFLKVDTEAAPDLAQRYNIRSIPTLMMFQRGAAIARTAGTLDAGTLRNCVRQHLQ
jgi:thioredoxin 2